MKISADMAKGHLLSDGYPHTAGFYDEMSAAPGVLRPHWDEFIHSLSALGDQELDRRWQTARQRIRENGVTYNVYGDPLGMDRPWNLDAIPLMIPRSEWSLIEAGLIQRARLLNLILADLYGPQRLLHEGLIPPALVFANPGFWRPCHGVSVSGNTYLHLLAVDLARGPDGDWWVISTARKRPPARAMRLKIASSWRKPFRIYFASSKSSVSLHFSVLFATRCSAFRLSLAIIPGCAAHSGAFQRNVLRALLPRALSRLQLVQGGDLTVRDSRVFLKTLEGLKQVDVILRRVDDNFCDPSNCAPIRSSV